MLKSEWQQQEMCRITIVHDAIVAVIADVAVHRVVEGMTLGLLCHQTGARGRILAYNPQSGLCNLFTRHIDEDFYFSRLNSQVSCCLDEIIILDFVVTFVFARGSFTFRGADFQAFLTADNSAKRVSEKGCHMRVFGGRVGEYTSAAPLLLLAVCSSTIPACADSTIPGAK
jgi:hypothetical protein